MADSMQTTVLTVDPDGLIGADFTGHVFAQGLDLFAAEPATEPDDRKVRWLRESDGKVLGFLTTIDNPNGGNVRLSAPGTHMSTLVVQEGNEPGTGFIEAIASAAKGGGKNVTLITDTGLSDLLKLAVQADVKLAFGVTEVEFPGGAALSNKPAVNHGLGRVPIAVLATVGPEANEQGGVARTRNYTKTSFNLQLRQWEGAAPAAGTKIKVSWIAIG